MEGHAEPIKMPGGGPFPTVAIGPNTFGAYDPVKSPTWLQASQGSSQVYYDLGSQSNVDAIVSYFSGSPYQNFGNGFYGYSPQGLNNGGCPDVVLVALVPSSSWNSPQSGALTAISAAPPQTIHMTLSGVSPSPLPVQVSSGASEAAQFGQMALGLTGSWASVHAHVGKKAPNGPTNGVWGWLNDPNCVLITFRLPSGQLTKPSGES